LGTFALTALSALGCTLGLDMLAPEALDAGLSGDDTADPSLAEEGEADPDEGLDTASTGDDGPSGGNAGTILLVDAVTPAFGPVEGGSEVAVGGDGFDASARVWFDGVEATVLSWSASELVVETPVMGTLGRVDVDVETTDGLGVLPGGFEALDFADARGLSGALGAVEVYDVLGGYWGPGMEDFGLAWWWLLDTPENVHFWQLFAGDSMGSCSRNAYDPAAYPELNVDMQSMLTVGGVSFAMQDAIGNGVERQLATTDYVSSASWDLSATSATLPDFAVMGFARTPADFALTAPANLSGSAVPTLGPSQLDFAWTGADGDLVLIYIKRYADDGSLVESVGCAADASVGTFSVPSSAFSTWTSGHTLYIYVGNVIEGDAVLPYNNSTSAVAGISWKLGGAVTTP